MRMSKILLADLNLHGALAYLSCLVLQAARALVLFLFESRDLLR
jgi:hypothetical protein